MFAYIEGRFTEKNPAFAVIDCGGVGYHIEISLTTYSQIKDLDTGRLLTHFVVREDAQLLYGFFREEERALFRQLINVSGIGANTARMMLSSLSNQEILHAILNGNVSVLQSIKGIGAKTAQRIVLELQDKLSKDKNSSINLILPNNKTKEEALSALVTLGFSKIQSEKTIDKILKDEPEISIELLIKQALRLL